MEYKDSLKAVEIEMELPSTIDDCHTVIRSYYRIIVEFADRINELYTEVKLLRERLNINSSNSSTPPSKSFKKNKKQKSPSPNKSGGQAGHEGHFRPLLDSGEADEIVDCKLPTICECGSSITSIRTYQRHQVYKLPEIKLHMTEYRLEKGYCPCCGKNHTGSLPEGITWGITGSNLTGLVSHLISKYGLSRREVREFLREQFKFDISLGTVFNKQKIINTVLAPLMPNLLIEAKQSPSINIDETGHNRDGKNQWLWGIISTTAAFFSVQSSRGKNVLDALVGDYTKVIISDRHNAYSYFNSAHRQICWAHLKRDFTRLSEKEDKIIARIGSELLACEADLFKIWYEFKQGDIIREELLRRSYPIRKRVGELLEQGTYTDPKLRAARFCKNILKDFDALWTFLLVENVEPTNNHAERSLRHAVIWRKKYFCTRSDYGSEFVARTMSVIMTCKLQSKSSFEFICQALKSHFLKTTAPPALISRT